MRHLVGALLTSLIVVLIVVIQTSSTKAESSSSLSAIIGFERETVNASEGNVAVVCVTALFMSAPVTVNVSLMNVKNDSGVAGIVITPKLVSWT